MDGTFYVFGYSPCHWVISCDIGGFFIDLLVVGVFVVVSLSVVLFYFFVILLAVFGLVFSLALLLSFLLLSKAIGV